MVPEANLADGSCRYFNRLSAISGKRSEIMGAGELIGDCSKSAEVKALRYVPGSSDLQRMKTGSFQMRYR